MKCFFIWLTPDPTSKLINKAIEKAKNSITLPYQINTTTTLTDITAEQNAIRYHEILSGVDSDNLTNSNMKENLLSNACLSKDTKSLLDGGINMEYSYTVKDTQKTFFITLKKEDCLNYQINAFPL